MIILPMLSGRSGVLSPKEFIYAALIGTLVAYVLITVSCWDIDNDFFPRVTLVHWIYVNQIQHIWRMLHELW